jgi:peptidyl-prolyl cis-trans isomerase B (cyclophilin B)
MKKRILCVVLAGMLLFALCACGNTAPTPTSTPTPTPTPTATPAASPDPDKVNVVIETEKGTIKAELYPDVAPITVANFQKLVSEGFYDGLTFHRIIEGFMIQGGDPKGNGSGGSPDKIKGEFLANGVENNLKHERGVLSMARSNAMDSASSQFFIMQEAAPHLDGLYAAFGKVTEGIEVVDKIVEETPVPDPQSGLVAAEEQPKIISIRFE